MVNKELEKFIPIVNLIAKTFGKNCEVVLHDLSTPQCSVVYTVNNHVTGRQVGQSFDHLIKNVLLSKNFRDDYLVNYMFETNDHRKIKSSTALIRDSNCKVVGALCVNYNLESLKELKNIMEEFMAAEEEKIEKEVEPIQNVLGIVDEIIDKIVDNENVNGLKRSEKIEIIRFMDSKGIFLIKGAIEKVADKLNISKVTVYSYLDEIRKEENVQ
ncbi:PAS domain-containing protein [Proteiniborus sp.]|uniref:helix-turn-helix transcriptional regulator n=1 Tax=Proteiniborus sp. TaxID=2079015 RepID=UPI0033272A38